MGRQTLIPGNPDRIDGVGRFFCLAFSKDIEPMNAPTSRVDKEIAMQRAAEILIASAEEHLGDEIVLEWQEDRPTDRQMTW